MWQALKRMFGGSEETAQKVEEYNQKRLLPQSNERLSRSLTTKRLLPSRPKTASSWLTIPSWQMKLPRFRQQVIDEHDAAKDTPVMPSMAGRLLARGPR